MCTIRNMRSQNGIELKKIISSIDFKIGSIIMKVKRILNINELRC